MPDLNKVFLMGRLTFDPELRRTPNGTAVTELRMATSRTWSGRDGDRREETLFIDVTVWDRQAETCCQYLRKGSSVHVEGSLRMDTWDDKTTGEKRQKIRIHADRVQFLDSRRGDGGDAPSGAGMDDEMAAPPTRESGPRRNSGGGYGAGNGMAGGRSASPPGPSPRSRPAPAAEPDEGDEDIPF
jgi:single-strand DNA-binding protein